MIIVCIHVYKCINNTDRRRSNKQAANYNLWVEENNFNSATVLRDHTGKRNKVQLWVNVFIGFYLHLAQLLLNLSESS